MMVDRRIAEETSEFVKMRNANRDQMFLSPFLPRTTPLPPYDVLIMKAFCVPLTLSLVLYFVAGCSVPPPTPQEASAYTPALRVLETNCVHCHGDNRLSQMPPMPDTSSLASLIHKGGWIVPGKPEKSRLYQVVTFPDEIPGAMPPTGHAIRKADVKILRDWIKAGAPLPKANQELKPRGTLPRSV